ncbi:MAG TPA: hypothetical protein VFT59_01455 [Candidatus Saccharimonadales bacterium]|nr:hypothetical protein [Candidatus Saccharimonadales bacterium]
MKKHRSHESSLNKKPVSTDKVPIEMPSEAERKEEKKSPTKESEKEAAKARNDRKEKVTKNVPHGKEKKKRDKIKNKVNTPEEKKEKRTEAVEKSRALKQHFEDSPIPQDPRLVARLIIADHVMTLHEQLEEPGEKTDISTRELVAALDYMSELAEKLEDPSIEATPTIEEAYESLLELTEHALARSAPEEIIYQAGNSHNIEEKPKESVQPDTSQSPHHNPSAQLKKPSPLKLANVIIASTIHSLKNFSSPTSPPINSLRDASTGHYVGSKHEDHALESSRSSSRSLAPPRLNRLSPTEARHEYLRAVAREHHATRPLISSTAPIAAAAITSSMRPVPPEAHHLSPAPYNSTPSPDALASSQLPEQYTPLRPVESKVAAVATSKASLLESRPTPSLPHTPPYFDTQPLSTPTPSESVKKLEHLPLQTLLTIADNIPVGYGRYLRKEFEQNHLDRAGLVKVLKAHAKGKDFAKEYRHQAEEFRLAKTSLEHPSPHSSVTDRTLETVSSTPSISTTHEELHHETDIPKPFMNVNESAAPLMSPKPDVHHSQTKKWLIVALVACTVLTALVIFIFVI